MNEQLSILFVNNTEEDTLEILNFLHGHGFDTVSKLVPTADSLQKMLFIDSWNLIISDYQLLSFDALAALKIVKKNQLNIPFIVIADAIGERAVVNLLKAGVADYLNRDDLISLPAIIRGELTKTIMCTATNQVKQESGSENSAYLRMFEHAVEGLYQSTPDGHYLLVNRSLANIYGYDSPEHLSEGLTDIKNQLYVDPQRRDEFLSLIRQQGIVTNFESKVYHRDGTTRWISENARLGQNKDGSEYYEGFVSDISDRKHVEAALQLSEARATAVFSQAAVGLVESNMETGQIILTNACFCKMLGYSEAELLSRKVLDVTHPEDALATKEKIAQLFSGQINYFTLEKRYIRQDGTVFLAETTVYLVHLEGGRNTTCLALIQDISDRKKAEQTRDRLFNLSLDLLCVSTIDGYFVELNPAWEKTLGYSRYELLSNSFIDFVHPEDQAATIAKFHYLASQEIVIDFENRYRCRDGSYKWLSWRSTPDNESGLIYAIARDVTELKQAQQELLRLNQELETTITARTKALAMTQAAVDWAPDGVFLIRPDGSFYYANKTACDTLGYSQEEIHQLSITDINPTLTPSIWVEYWQMIKSNSIWTLEYEHQTKDGLIYPVEVNSRYMEFDGEEYSFSFVRDIRERKIAEAKIKQTNRFRQQILENITDGLCVSHQTKKFPFLNFTVWNPQMQLITGYTMKEINQLGWVQCLMPNEDAQKYMIAGIERLQQENQLISEDVEIRRKDGRKRIISVSASILNLGEKKLNVLALMQDVTERKQNLQSARLLANVVESTEDAIITKNLEGIITSWNSGAVNLFGYTETEAIGQPISILWPSQVREEELRMLAQITQGSRMKHFETVRLRNDGSSVPVSVAISPLKDEAGKIVGASKILRDITERKQAEIKLQKSNEEMMRATRLKDEFLANMSHELRTPLNAILGMAEGLLEEVFGNIFEQQIKPLKTIERSGNHLLELINDILDVAKIESGQMILDLNPTAMEPLCQSSLVLIKQQANKKRLRVELKIPTNLPLVMIDERRIRQVLINLLSNAVKFTPEGGKITLEVGIHSQETIEPKSKIMFQGKEVRVFSPQNIREKPILPLVKEQRPQEQKFLQISIRDTGIGIAAEDMKYLFKPFVQVDSALIRKYSGSGLGLSLVKSIIDLHGGKVEVKSKIGVGSCFTVYLPYISVKSSSPAIVIQDHNIYLDLMEHQESALILLAEDNEANISTFANYLRAKGYRLELAKNGREAIALSQSLSPDLILMDIQMPEIDGLEAIRQIRCRPTNNKMPIIALTALAMKGDCERCLEVGADGYLAKPVKLKELHLAIQKFLVSKRSQKIKI